MTNKAKGNLLTQVEMRGIFLIQSSIKSSSNLLFTDLVPIVKLLQPLLRGWLFLSKIGGHARKNMTKRLNSSKNAAIIK